MGTISYVIVTIIFSIAAIIWTWTSSQHHTHAATTQQVTIATTQSNSQALSVVARSEKFIMDAHLRIVIRKNFAAIEQSVSDGQAMMGYAHSTMIYDSSTMSNELTYVTRILESAIHNTSPPMTLKRIVLTKSAATSQNPASKKTQDWIGSVDYALVFLFAWWLMRVALNMVYEKKDQIIEVVLSTVSVRTLILGKIIGLGIALFLQMLLPIISSLAVGAMVGKFVILGASAGTIAITCIWIILGYAAYATLAIRISAMTPSAEESQQYSFLGVVPLIIGLMAAAFVEANPSTTGIANLIKVLLVGIPMLSPFLVPVYWMLGQLTLWQVALVAIENMCLIYVLYLRWAPMYEATVLETTPHDIWNRIARLTVTALKRLKAQLLHSWTKVATASSTTEDFA